MKGEVDMPHVVLNGDVLLRDVFDKMKRRMKKALAWELEDQLTELKELLSLSHITQEEYEQKKKLLEKSGSNCVIASKETSG